MLSSPPRSFAARISARLAASRSTRLALRGSRRSSPASTIVVSPSEQSRKTSPSARLDGEGVDVDLGLGAERAGDHRALRVHLGLLGRELAAAHELGDERVVLGQLLELAVAQQVGARVADVADRRRFPSAWNSATVIVVPIPEADASLSRPLVDAQVRRLDQRDDAALGPLGRGRGRVSRSALGGERRGDLARLRAAHPVGDREERRARRRRRPRCGAACGRCSSAAEPCAILIARTAARSRRSGRRRRARAGGPLVSRIPLTKVPLVEPTSST